MVSTCMQRADHYQRRLTQTIAHCQPKAVHVRVDLHRVEIEHQRRLELLELKVSQAGDGGAQRGAHRAEPRNVRRGLLMENHVPVGRWAPW